jgi:thioredoxin reductase (NADPH)
MKDVDVDIAVIGGGLAGLNAGLAAAQAGRSCTVFCGAAPGGLLLSIEAVQGLPEHPEGVPGYDLGPMTQEAAMDAGADCLSADAESVVRDGERWVVRCAEGTVRARAVILAPGSHLRTLGVPGEDRLVGKGVSHCASCDAPMLRGRAVAVVGGGDAACQEALTIAAHAGQVHLLVRGAALRARPAWQQRVAAQPKITPRFGSVVEEILGEQAVSGVRLAGGDSLAVDAVFAYAGLVPHTAWLGGLVPLDADGHIPVDADLRTAVPGLFAAGTARAGHSGQAADAVADGIAAAQAAHRYLDSL